MTDLEPQKNLKLSPQILQFIRFCLVGLSSFIIDVGISYVLTYKLNIKWEVSKTISFTLAVTNSFLINRKWTFDAIGQREHHTQYAMFFSVNVVGYLLNLFIMKGVLFLETGSISGNFAKKTFFIATLAATACVVFWNFFANKHWTFKEPKPATED